MGSDDLAKKRISANKKRRLERKENRKLRAVGNRPLIPNILILTEGYSEKLYIEELISLLSLNTVNVKKSSYTSSKAILHEAENEVLKFNDTDNELNYIFCIFDLDTVKNREHLQVLSEINSTCTKIIPIYSFPCIEIWFILHFSFNTRPFQQRRNKSIGEAVKSHFKNKYAKEYSETNETLIKSLVPKYQSAISNSIRLYNEQIKTNCNNPMTNMHDLVNLLESISNRTPKQSNETDKGEYLFDEQCQKYMESKINT